MDETHQPKEEMDSSNPFEVEEAPAEASETAASTEAGDTVVTTETVGGENVGTETPVDASDPVVPPPAAPAKDPWAETAPIITPPEPDKTPLLLLGALLLAAAGAMVMLWLQDRSLQAKIDGLSAGLQQANAQVAGLQAQVDHAAQPVSPQSGDLRIISAIYGSGVSWVDVTPRVTELLRRTDSEFFMRPEWLLADPTPGFNKELVVTFQYQGHRHLFNTGEGEKVSVAVLLDSAK